MNGSWNFLPRWKKKLPIYIIHYALRARKLVSKAGFSGWLKFFCKTVHVLSRATVCTAVCVCVIPTWNRVVRSPLVYSTRSFLSLSPLSTAIAGTFLEKKRSVKIARILRFFSLFLLLLPLFKNCTSDYSSSKTGHQQTINRYLSKR